MKKLFAALAIIIVAGSAHAADKYEFDKDHTNILWFADHFGYSEPFGYFNDFDGTLSLDEKAPENSKLEITIKTSSLSTPIEKFTTHLKSKDFFDVEQYPAAKFVSTKVEKTAENTAKVTGDFTLLGVTKPLVLDVKLNKIGKHPFTQKYTAGFSATATIKRSEFGMNYGIPGVGDDIRIFIESETTRVENVTDKK